MGVAGTGNGYRLAQALSLTQPCVRKRLNTISDPTKSPSYTFSKCLCRFNFGRQVGRRSRNLDASYLWNTHLTADLSAQHAFFPFLPL